jgi:glucose/arabinose dehydrogenase
MTLRLPMTAIAAAMLVTACSANGQSGTPTREAADNLGPLAAETLANAPFTLTQVADFEDPWAIAFIPDSPFALVTEQAGKLMLWEQGGAVREVAGVPAVSYAGQGGLGDVALHPDFATNRLVYLTWAEEGEGGKGAALGRGRLSADMTRLENFETIWRAQPFVTGNGHFGHRIAFGPDGMLYLSTGERQKFDPAQDMDATLGKVLRLTDSGGVPADNPFASAGGARAQIWSLGQRNPLGLAFDADGRLWEMEMGPAGGDELNLIERGSNYGYPTVSNGDHYDGRDIPDHSAGDGFVAPKLWWNPAISPGDLTIYSGDAFADWRGDAFIAALGATGLVRVDLDGATARHGNRWDLGFRVRAVRQGNDGTLWLLEDGGNQGDGRLYRLTPRS